ncbi:MAG TPA: hypothetical protein IAB35_03325 [Candidatus Faecimonas gallistercoris]|nr:hypothetical protein [Candidatus Faecimonas gallistercoris]
MKEQEFLQTLIKELDISNYTKGRLLNHGIETVEDLLKIDYEDLTKLRQLGKKGLKEISTFLHQMGYKIKNEESDKEVKREQLKEEGKVLLEDLGLKRELYSILYREGIFTLQELNNHWKEIPEIKGYGPRRQIQLSEQLSFLGIKVTEEGLQIPEEVTQTIDNQEEINKLVEKPGEKQTQEERDKLLALQQSLLAEKQQLQLREQEIDKELANIRGELFETRKRK